MSNGIYDVAFGPIANLIAAALIYLLRNRRLIGCVIGSTVIGLIVGSYIWAIFGTPSNVFGLELPLSWPVWVVSIVSITVSSLVAIAIIGYILLTILSKPTILEPLKSKGLKVVAEREKAT
jgi:predicted membrane protein